MLQFNFYHFWPSVNAFILYSNEMLEFFSILVRANRDKRFILKLDVKKLESKAQKQPTNKIIRSFILFKC